MQKENRNRIMNLKQLSIIYTLIVIVINDCPIIPYPRNTIVSKIYIKKHRLHLSSI